MDKRILFILPAEIPVKNVLGDNTGNYVYYLALLSYFCRNEKLTMLTVNEIKSKLKIDKEYIKAHFDIAVMAEANLFALYYKDSAIIENANFVKSLLIPCYIVGIGIQNNIENDLNNLKPIDDLVKNYVDIVLNSGGTLTLRGELTNDYLKSLGYNDLFVSGCPSMYINGEKYFVSNEKVSKEEFKPLFNAANVRCLAKRLYKMYPNSAFFDQDVYLKALFCPETQADNELLMNFTFIDLFKNGQISGDINYFPWKKQIIDNQFNFSYGSRIHGNIIALQSKVPACVKVIDSRTKEISEFYNIPNTIKYPFNEKKDSLYDLYKSLDFEKFNDQYTVRYNNFKKFLVSIFGNSVDIGQNNFDEYLESFEYISFDKNYWQLPEYKNLVRKLTQKTMLKPLKKIAKNFRIIKK